MFQDIDFIQTKLKLLYIFLTKTRKLLIQIHITSKNHIKTSNYYIRELGSVYFSCKDASSVWSSGKNSAIIPLVLSFYTLYVSYHICFPIELLVVLWGPLKSEPALTSSSTLCLIDYFPIVESILSNFVGILPSRFFPSESIFMIFFGIDWSPPFSR